MRSLSARSLLYPCLATVLLAACGGNEAASPIGPSKGGAGGRKSGAAGTSGASGNAAGGSAGRGTSGNGAAGNAIAGSAGAAGASKAGAGGTTGGAGGFSAGAGGSAGAKPGGAAGTSAGAGGLAGKGGAAAGSGAGGGSAGKGGSAGGTNGGNAGTGQFTCANPSKLTLSPATITIVVENGVAAPAVVTASATCEGGKTASIEASYTIDKVDVASVSAGGLVTAGTDKGGEATVTGAVNGLTATAKVVVKIHDTVNEAPVTPAQKSALENPQSNGAVALVYPYDRTMFAKGLLPPELMWNEPSAAEACLVHIQEDFYKLDAIVPGAQPGRWDMSDAVWDALTTSNHGEDVTVDVSCVHGAVASSSVQRTWRVAPGSLRGSIYYWAVDKGQIVKLVPGAKASVPVFDSGPPDQVGSPAPSNYDGKSPPWDANDSSKRCVACHTVSKDGSRLASTFSARGSQGPWGAVDLVTGTVSQLGTYGQNTMFQALTPEGKYIVTNQVDMKLRFADASTGAGIGSLLDSFDDKLADPAFSHDGKKLAFSGSAIGGNPVEMSFAKLEMVDFDPQGLSFANRRVVRPSDDGSCISFPSFSPGSDFIVYEKGDYSRAKYGDPVRSGNDDLYVTNLDGSLGDVLLAAASGNHLDARNQHRNYQPTVNPIAVGGYMWVVFVSPRDYGNRHVSTGDPGLENRKQLWVTAVDLAPKPGVDPSHPAFLLEGQSLETINMSGYWSLEACHKAGDTCEAGYDCCGGFCRGDATGKRTCADTPPIGSCSKLDDKCGGGGDCCKEKGVSLGCVGGFCALIKD